ncbi:hypothetical protein A3759_03580 [Thalassolituus sp. HI0120]|nr:hypothetical protein A3759_03580 [Thalassolituus sp. HI0120]
MRKLLTVSIVTAMSIPVSAVEDNDFSVYGFVNLGVYYKDQAYTTIETYEDGDPTFFENDTMLGLQVSKPLSERTSATVQIIADGENDFHVDTSLAFISHALNENTDLRAGRLRIPFFYYSEFLDVGYAYNWVRPTSDVYSIPFDDYDGVDITHRFSLGDSDAQVQVNSGRRNKDINLFGENYESQLNRINGISLTLFSGDFTHRLGYQQTEMNLDLRSDPAVDNDALAAYQAAAAQASTPAESSALGTEAILATYSAAGYRRVDLAQAMARFVGDANGFSADVIDKFDLDKKLARYFNVASTYDNGDFSLVLEATHLKYDSGLLVDNFAWLGGVAQRFGDVTLHATYSTSRDRVPTNSKGDLQKLLKLEGEDKSVTVGIRYDMDAATALKFEATHHDEETNRGVAGRSANLYRAALQLVF